MKITLFDAGRHKRSGFKSGDTPLDEYLKRHLSQGVKKGIVKAYVAADDEGNILGYYTLSAAHILHNELPEAEAKKFPRYPIPAALLGRMATAITAREAGMRVGARLLIHAMKQTLRAAETLGVACLVVDAKPEAVGFYERFGFMRLRHEDELRLYLPVTVMRKLAG